ncbi:hypothetical protein NQ317_014823 [Molorchus minor]|uniref:Uncharacterized protein n=1 Tax=Molorchus minor TaxID=1323400 RepID=A0ABQ9ISN9_9CUCU|nr:hypothetical protein NQ317_014823 [Molorchus minor]
MESGDGFVLNGELICQSKKTGDYYEEMNAKVYECFGQILENFEPGSVSLFQEWVRDKGFPYDKSSLKAELLQLVKLHADKYKKGAVDELALIGG